jgi:FG-GAP repeat
MSVRSNRGHRCVMALAAIGCALALSACGPSSKPASSAPAAHATPGDFGWSVALDGSTAVVGAPFKNSDTGAAYVFVRSGTAWSQQAKLTASDATSGGQFGFSVALDGSTAVVGAPGKNSKTGAAYVFARSGTAWSQQAKLTATHV